jgi:hypothetical protein
MVNTEMYVFIHSRRMFKAAIAGYSSVVRSKVALFGGKHVKGTVMSKTAPVIGVMMFAFYRRWHLHWGATDIEAHNGYEGDQLVSHP